jgi:hypothetical protein
MLIFYVVTLKWQTTFYILTNTDKIVYLQDINGKVFDAPKIKYYYMKA